MKNPEVSELLLVSSNFLEDRVNNNEIRGTYGEAVCILRRASSSRDQFVRIHRQ